MENLRPIMFVGTGSDVGKSVICAGMCRILKQDGFDPAPFKGQNMSLNSYATPEGFEIGRAQAVQAEAAGVAPHTDMNPVLLKPTDNQSSQVVLHGRPKGNQSAINYFKSENRKDLFKEVLKSFLRLREKYNPIVIEGAGSISEINLKDRDITNMCIAIESNAATYLIADIDRGGVFASVYGSIQLLEPKERRLIKGIIINKFRGDIRLFKDGRKKLEEITNVPVVGVIPYYKDIFIDEEDSVAIANKYSTSQNGLVNIAVVLLRRMSNFTDFNMLERDPSVHLFFTDLPEDLMQADIIIIPGSKNTISDLIEIRKKGLVKAILQAHEKGKKVIGICGGFQMLGQMIEDPEHVEGEIDSMPGIGLLPVKTVLEKEKTTRQCTFAYKDSDQECTGYEIHMGKTFPVRENNPVNFIGEKEDGYWLNERCWGTYIHGILDNQVVIDDLVGGITAKVANGLDHKAFKNQQYDKLANHLRQNMDMDFIYDSIQH